MEVKESLRVCSVFLAAANVIADRMTHLEPTDVVPQVVYLLDADGLDCLNTLTRMLDVYNERITSFNMDQIRFLLVDMYKGMGTIHDMQRTP